MFRKKTVEEKSMAKIIWSSNDFPYSGDCERNGEMGLEETPYWKLFFDAIPPVRMAKLRKKKPDVNSFFFTMTHGLEVCYR